jgi:hypothetical protein
MPCWKKIYNEQTPLMLDAFNYLLLAHLKSFSMAPPTFIQCTSSNCSSGQATTFINLKEHRKCPKCDKNVYEILLEEAPPPPPAPSGSNIQHPNEQILVDTLRSHRVTAQTARHQAAPYSTSESRRRRTSVCTFIYKY